MSRFTLRSGAALLVVILAAQPAWAQKVDYAALEATLGEPVTTSVTGKPQRASEAPAALTIITRDEIARSPARDIPGLLKLYAGVDVNRWTAGQTDVAVRGSVQNYNPRLLVMVDGRQVYLDHYGMTNWNLIGVPIEEIQQIELVRGPASAIFGFNAASGVVNIITRGSDKARVDGTAEGGDHGYSRLALTGAAPLGRIAGIRLSAERAREDERAIPTGHYVPTGLSQQVERESLSGSLTVRPDATTEVELSGGYARNKQQEYLARPSLAEPLTQTTTASIRVTHDLGWGSVDGQVYSNWLDFDNLASADLADAKLTGEQIFKNNVTVAKVSLLARLGTETTLRLGGEYRDNRIHAPILYSPAIHYGVWSANAMLDLHPTDRIAITGAARVDRLSLEQDGTPFEPVIIAPGDYDRSFTTLSFNSSILVAVGDTGQLRLNGGRGYQSPSLLAFGLHVPAQITGAPLPLIVSGRPDIEPADVWSVELGYGQSVGSTMHVDGSLFYTKTGKPIMLPNQAFGLGATLSGVPILTSLFANLPDVTSYGVELGWTGKFGPWRGQLNYTWIRTDDNGISAQNGVGFTFNPAAATAAHKVDGEIGYEAHRWFATLVGRYTSAIQPLATLANGNVAPVSLPDTLAVDAKLGIRLTSRLTLEAAGNNLTKVRGAAGSPIWADRRVRAGVKIAL